MPCVKIHTLASLGVLVRIVCVFCGSFHSNLLLLTTVLLKKKKQMTKDLISCLLTSSKEDFDVYNTLHALRFYPDAVHRLLPPCRFPFINIALFPPVDSASHSAGSHHHSHWIRSLTTPRRHERPHAENCQDAFIQQLMLAPSFSLVFFSYIWETRCKRTCNGTNCAKHQSYNVL